MRSYSVLMSVYQREKSLFLKQAVMSMLTQDVAPEQFVLVCDGPLNDSLDRVIDDFEKQYPDLFQVVRLPENRGLASALNEGLKACTCPWIARMDSDDIALPDRIRKQFDLQEKSGAGLLSGTVGEFSTSWIGEDDEVKKETIESLLQSDKLSFRRLPEDDAGIRKFARKRNPMNHPAVLMRKDAVEKAGGYDSRYPYFEDYDLWLRMLKEGTVAANTGDPILLMRADEGLYERRGGKEYRKYMQAFRKRMWKEKDCSYREYISSVWVRNMVAVAPSGVRKKFYGKVLRK